MYKISQLVGKKLLDVNTARDLGQICGIAWSKSQGNCAIITDEGRFVAEKIFSVKDAVSVVTPQTADGYQELNVGKTVYDTTGTLLGTLADVEIGSTLKIAFVHLDDETAHTRGKLYAASDVLLIRAKTPSRKSATPKTADGKGQGVAARGRKLTSAARWLQNRRYGDFSFLIGKTVDKTITNFQGELMIKQGQRVTNTILRQAKVSGKLIELCLHTK